MLKDDRLADLARHANVAQFVSFGPGDPALRHRVLSGSYATPPHDLLSAVIALRAAARPPYRLLNVRTFRDEDSKGTPFLYGLSSVDEVVREVRRLAADGYYTIVNETVDITDGGVSGVFLGGIAEFAPGATPRAVEQADAAALPAPLALKVLRTVYGPVDIEPDPLLRMEFSVHPGPVGTRHGATLLWEVADVEGVTLSASPTWPNAFSRHIGDKAYGLLIGHHLGLPVPRTTVVARRVAPFTFGVSTSTGATDRWIRTCPAEPQPGLFTSARGWLDPFALLVAEDPTESRIASVLDQDGVDALWAGATALAADGSVVVEGVRGAGDGFMLGDQPPEPLPKEVLHDVLRLVHTAISALGGVRVEWSHDGSRAWLLQMHRASRQIADGVLNPGDADRWVPFNPDEGLEVLRSLVAQLRGTGVGVDVQGAVGLTSHVGDILRKAGVPGRRVDV